MTFANPLTVLIATLLAGPALWRAFVQHDLELGDAATRFLIALIVAGVMQWLIRGLANMYKESHPRRRTTDHDSPREPGEVVEGEPPLAGTPVSRPTP
jgi:hypothetical protein